MDDFCCLECGEIISSRDIDRMLRAKDEVACPNCGSIDIDIS